MMFFRILLTNPITLFIVFSILENAFIIKLYRFWEKNAPFSPWKLLCCILLSVVLMTITYKILFTSDYRESQVDTSPLAELTSEQIDRLEDAIVRFKEFDFITRFDYSEVERTGIIQSKKYDLIWRRQEPHSLLRISITFYYDEQRAIDYFQFGIEIKNEHRRPYTLIENDNNTEALLAHSMMERNSDTLFFPDSSRYISSGLRLGNAYISLNEQQEYNNLDKNISSEFIKLLCEMLQEEEIEEV